MTNPQSAAPGVAVEAQLTKLLALITDFAIESTPWLTKEDASQAERKAYFDGLEKVTSALRTALLASAAGGNQIPVAEVVAGNLGSRLMWHTSDAQELTPVGTLLYAQPVSDSQEPVMTIGIDESEKCRSLPFGMKLYAHPPAIELANHEPGLLRNILQTWGFDPEQPQTVKEVLAKMHTYSPPVPVRAPQEVTEAGIEAAAKFLTVDGHATDSSRKLATSRLVTGALPAETVPAGVLRAISNAGLTLTKNQQGYELKKFGPCTALAATPAGAGQEPLTTKEIADLTAMVWGAPVFGNDLKVAEFVIRTHEAILKTGERPKDPVDGGRFIKVPGAFGEVS